MDVNRTAIDLTLQIDLAQEADFRIGTMQVRPSLREIVLPGETITLEPRVMQVLVALARTPGEVNSKWDLIQSCWHGRSVGDDAIARCIAGVRRLEAAGGIRVTTIPRVGYRLTEAVAAPPAQASSGEAPQPAIEDATDASRIAQRFRNRLVWAAGAAVAVLAGAYVFGIARWDGSPKPVSVAVLPFDANNSDPAEIGYARQVSANLASRIAPFGLDVIAPAQSRRFSGEAKYDAYSALHTTFIMDGNVTREAGRIRVTIHLDDRASRQVLFSKSFEAPQADAALLSKRVSAITADRMRSLACIDPAQPQQAREMLGFWDELRSGNPQAGLAKLRRIAQESPHRGNLQLLYAQVNASMIGTSPMALRRERFEEALKLYDKVRQIDPGNGAHSLAQYSLTPASNWAEREAALRKALSATSGDGTAQLLFGLQLMNAGYLEEASMRLNAAVQKDPNFFITIYDAATANRLIQRWDLAQALLDDFADAVVEAPHPALLQSLRATLAEEAGDYDKALRIKNSGPLAQVKENALVPLNTQISRADMTRLPKDVAAAVEGCRTAGFPLQIFGRCLPVLSENGELDVAFAQLSRVIPKYAGKTRLERENNWFKSMDMPFSRFSIPQLYHPRNAAIRADPRFIELARQLNLIDYWRTRGPPDFCRREDARVCAMIAQHKH